MRSSPDTTRRRATVIGALLEGWRRAILAPWVTAGILLVTILVSLPLAFTLREEIAADLGASTTSERVERGWDADWTREFGSRAGSLGRTFTHEILGFGGTLATLDRIVNGIPVPRPLVGAVAAYLLVWVFLSSGVVDRMARARPLGSMFFLATCGRFFPRALRLSLISGGLYVLLFLVAHDWLFGTVFDQLTTGTTNETRALAIRGALYVVLLLAMAAVSLVSDMTRVRLVVEDRRSIFSAAGSALRFIRKRPGRLAGLYALNILAQVILARLWMQMEVGAGAPDWLALLAAQVYLVARIWARIGFVASEVVFFQGELAHAGFAAAPLTRWPDSASVEAVRAMKAR